MMNIRFLKIGIGVICGIGVLLSSFVEAAPTGAAKGIRDTKHNLSNWGTGSVRASGSARRDTEVCIFCHAPHNAESTQVPLWNHTDTTTSPFGMASSHYLAPDGTYMDTEIGAISRKCMSCHDGTVAVGAVKNAVGATTDAYGNIAMTGVDSEGKLSSSNNSGSNTPYIGTNLTQGHIISFKYDETLRTYLNSQTEYTGANFAAFPDTDPDRWKMLDKEKKMQCHTCHDPHTDWCDDGTSPGTVGGDPLWRLQCDDGTGSKTGKAGSNATVCVKCHSISFGSYTQGSPW